MKNQIKQTIKQTNIIQTKKDECPRAILALLFQFLVPKVPPDYHIVRNLTTIAARGNGEKNRIAMAAWGNSIHWMPGESNTMDAWGNPMQWLPGGIQYIGCLTQSQYNGCLEKFEYKCFVGNPKQWLLDAIPVHCLLGGISTLMLHGKSNAIVFF